MSSSKYNNTVVNLAGNKTFSGIPEDVSAYGSYTISLRSSTNVELTILQGVDGKRWDSVRIVPFNSLPVPITTQDESPHILKGLITSKYYKLQIKNTEATDQIYMRCETLFRTQQQLNSLDDSVSVVGNVSVINSMKATYIDGGVETLKDVACDENGVLKSNLVVEGITLNPTSDAISIYGSNDGVPTAISCDADGHLAVDVKIEGITLTPQTDGISIYGTDGANPVALKTSTLNGEEGNILVANSNINKLEFNANKPPSLKFVGANLSATAGDPVSIVVDLGTDENRDRNIVFYGEADVSVATNPKLIMKFADDEANGFYGDGGYASFYKHPSPSTKWEFCFQRANCPLRYVQLWTETDANIDVLRITSSKN